MDKIHVEIVSEKLNIDVKYKNYLKKAYDKYSLLKTLLYSDYPRKFYDFYVCNDITQRVPIFRTGYKRNYERHYYRSATAETLSQCSRFIILSGTGGLGKSMMLRHLLLDSINNYDETKRIPIFIPLKEYDENADDLLRYVFEKFSALADGIKLPEFIQMLIDGEFLLLFDGLDEIGFDCMKKFERALEFFADQYSNNMFIISSRPFAPLGNFTAFNRFTVLRLMPFSKQKALELIDKLDFRSDEPSIKQNFRKELDAQLFFTHSEFIANPLLLTIMLMTYEQFAEIPSKMHVFYHEAYVALSQKHDASKGAYKRKFKTELTADIFADYLAEFCARTYIDDKFDLTETEFEKYFDTLKIHQKYETRISMQDFLSDLTVALCLMYYESGKYHFVHRSFQEYFCAVFFSKQKDKNLYRISLVAFENRRSKSWSDNNNEDGSRPESVKVRLLANGSAYGEDVTLDASGSPAWS
ncbi:MAG: NACHT domain-containing protein, partial [Selenomonadaceae bacterium]|nr:NACHT domain-containing protein [Selenomonadaceae bacterium]